MRAFIFFLSITNLVPSLGRSFECKVESIRQIPVQDCKIVVVNTQDNSVDKIEHPLRAGFVDHCPGVAIAHSIGKKEINYRPLEAQYEADCHDLCGNSYPFRFKGELHYSSENKPQGFNTVEHLGIEMDSFRSFSKALRSKCQEEEGTEYKEILRKVSSIQNHVFLNTTVPRWTHELWPNTPLIQEGVFEDAMVYKYRDQGNSLLVEIKYTSEAAAYYVKAVLANESFSQLRYPIERAPGVKKQLSISVGEVWALGRDQSFAAHTSMGFQIVKNEPALIEDEKNLLVSTIKILEDKGALVWDNVLLEGKKTPVAFNGSGEMLGVQILVPLIEGVGFDIYDYIVVKDGEEIVFKRVAETSRVLQFGSVK